MKPQEKKIIDALQNSIFQFNGGKYAKMDGYYLCASGSRLFILDDREGWATESHMFRIKLPPFLDPMFFSMAIEFDGRDDLAKATRILRTSQPTHAHLEKAAAIVGDFLERTAQRQIAWWDAFYTAQPD